MNFVVHSWKPEETAENLSREGPWDLIITSGLHLDEQRACWSNLALSSTERLEIIREGNTVAQFQLTFQEEKYFIDWRSLSCWMSERINKKWKILVDMNLLSLDILLYLYPALVNIGVHILSFIYVAPAKYTFDHESGDQRMSAIQQPRGYSALALDPDRQGARHLVFLGFDKARAWKFIDRYDWKEEHLYIVIANPPFVEGGVEKARAAAQPWLEDFERSYPEQVCLISGTNPMVVAKFCSDHFDDSTWLDLVPLGPKPMNLGILWFYFGLSEIERSRVRILYDFPTQRGPRSEGVAKVHYYSCQH